MRLKTRAANPLFLRRLSSIVLIGLFAAAFVAVLSAYPPPRVGAVVPDKICQGGSNSPVASITCTLSSVPVGDVILVAIVGPISVSGGLPATPTTNQSDIFTLQVQQVCPNSGFCAGGPYNPATVYSANAANGPHGDIITETWAAGNHPGTIVAMAVPGVSATAQATAVNSCTAACGTSFQTSTTITNNGGMLFGALYLASASTVGPVPSTGYNFLYGIAAAQNYGALYSGTIPPQENFAGTIDQTINGYALAGAYFQSTTIVNGGTGSVTIGACPAARVAGEFTPANNTLYFYYGTTTSTFTPTVFHLGIAGIDGTGASQPVKFAIYSTNAAGAVSVSNPLNLNGNFLNINISPGTVSADLQQTVSGLSYATVGVTIGIVFEGTDHIDINQSTLSGLYKQVITGGPGATMPGSFTSLGTSDAGQVAFCLNGKFNLSVTTTTTVTGTGSISTTTTTTTSGGQPIAQTVNYAIAIVVILGPAILVMAALGYIGGGVGAILGFMGGFTVGSGLAVYAVLVPTGWVFIAVIVDILFVLGAAAMARGGGPT